MKSKRKVLSMIITIPLSHDEKARLESAAGKLLDVTEFVRGAAVRAAEKTLKPLQTDRDGARVAQINIRLSENQRRVLARACGAHRMSMREWIRDAALEAARQ